MKGSSSLEETKQEMKDPHTPSYEDQGDSFFDTKKPTHKVGFVLPKGQHILHPEASDILQEELEE